MDETSLGMPAPSWIKRNQSFEMLSADEEESRSPPSDDLIFVKPLPPTKMTLDDRLTRNTMQFVDKEVHWKRLQTEMNERHSREKIALLDQRWAFIVKMLSLDTLETSMLEMEYGIQYDPEEQKENMESVARKKKPLNSFYVVPLGTGKSTRLDDESLKIHYVCSNQWGKGGGAACTAVAFVAAMHMLNCDYVEEMVKNIRWKENVLRPGLGIWNKWMEECRTDQEKSACTDYMMVEDFMRSEGFRGLITNLDPRIKRVTIGGRVSHTEEEQKRRSKQDQTSLPDMRFALRNMQYLGGIGGDIWNKKRARKCAGVITIGVYSLSIWKRGKMYAVFDSHGSGSCGNSALYNVVGVDAAFKLLMEITHSIVENNVYIQEVDRAAAVTWETKYFGKKSYTLEAFCLRP